MKVAFWFSVVFWSTVVFVFTGCAQLLGVKSYESGDTRIVFTSGFDVGISANQIDTVNNQRGIQPGEGVSNARK